MNSSHVQFFWGILIFFLKHNFGKLSTTKNWGFNQNYTTTYQQQVNTVFISCTLKGLGHAILGNFVYFVQLGALNLPKCNPSHSSPVFFIHAPSLLSCVSFYFFYSLAPFFSYFGYISNLLISAEIAHNCLT